MYINTKQYYYYCYYLKINHILIEWGLHKGNTEENNIIYTEVST